MSAYRPKIEPEHSPVATELEILPAWTDANGHMNVAYYVLAFDRATDTLYDALGIGWDYLERERKSVFTLAMNVDYLREVMAGSRVRIESRLLDHDQKRIHYFHAMHDARDGWLAATNELVAMHVDMATRRSSPFAQDTQDRLAAVRATQAMTPPPAQVGRKLGIQRVAGSAGATRLADDHYRQDPEITDARADGRGTGPEGRS